MSIKKRIQYLNEQKRQLRQTYNREDEVLSKRISNLQAVCKHDYEIYRGYDGTEYTCKICGHER